jgi:hypothetical protein
MSVCLDDDDFTHETCRWVVKLSNQQIVYQDDYRPGVVEWNAWKRLGQYTQQNNLYIIKMYLQFWTHICPVEPDNSDGYFFRHAAVGINGSWFKNYYIIGTLNNGILKTNKWAVPELIPEPEIIRDMKEAGPSLILKQGIII